MTKLIRKTQQPSDYPSNQIHDAYSTSTTDTYSCNYINDATNSSIAKITTNGEGSYTSAAKVTGIWVNDFSVGDIVAEASNSRIKITNTEILETGGRFNSFFLGKISKI